MITPLPSDPLLERLRQATLGLYEIRDELGRGGMAVVYMAKDIRLHRPVAIKVMQPSLLHAEGMTDRFLQEARIAAQLQHPNIIIVHDVQQQDDLLYFVMNLVEGATIDEMMRAAPFTITQVRWILSSAARGLAHAHSEGVVHRDVKPGNLLVNVKGDVIVTDFGIAKGADSVRMTQTGMAIGTPVYMSPEQVTGATGLSAASDQYSLGIAAYEMLAGAPPFTGESAFALQVAHVQKEPADITTRRSDCPPDLAFIVHRMLAKTPEQRWSSLDEVSALAAAALPFGGGDARKELAATARLLHDRRGLSTAAFGVRTPRSPLPRPSVAKERTSGSVTTLVLNPPASHLLVSGKVRLHSLAVVNGQDSGEHRAKWMSTDPNVAVVTEEGEVLGIGAGRAEIIAINQFGEARATIEVVSAPAPAAPRVDTPVPLIHTMSVDISPARVTMEGGDVVPLTVKVRDMRGSIVTDPVVEWHSDAPRVAFVDDRGVVAALATGHATISATVDGVTSRAAIEVATTWKTQNSLEQLAVQRPTPAVEAPITAVPITSAPITAAPITAAPIAEEPLTATRMAGVVSPAIVTVAEERPAAPVSTNLRSKSRSGVLIGGGVALLVVVATAWALLTSKDSSQSIEIADVADAGPPGVKLGSPDSAKSDTSEAPVVIAGPPSETKKTPDTLATVKRDTVRRTAGRTSGTLPPAPPSAGKVTALPQPQTASKPPAETTKVDSVAKPPAPIPATEKKETAPPPVPPAATELKPPANAGPPSHDAAVASAARDLNTQLQRKQVQVGPLKSFFQFGSDHVARVVGAPQVVSTTGGSVTAAATVEVDRTGPGGNIERRVTQITFRVVGTGSTATAQATGATNLQKR